MIGDVKLYANLLWGAGFNSENEPGVAGQNYVCSGGETSGPAYDLVDAKNTSVITLDTNGETTDFSIEFDLTNDIEVDSIIVDAHNFRTADAKIDIHYEDGVYDIQATMNTAYSGTLGTALAAQTITSSVVQNPADGILLMNLTAIDMTVSLLRGDGATTFNADVTIGEIYLCKKMEFSIAPETPEIIRNYNGITINESRGGQKSSYKRFGERKAWRLNWPILSETDKDNFLTVVETTEGRRYPFYIDLGEAATPQLYFVRFVQDSISLKKLTTNAYSLSFEVEAEV